MRAGFLALFLLAACATAPRADLNTVAADYVRLALEINKVEDGFVDAYYGPPEWRTTIDAAPSLSTAQLNQRADALLQQVSAISTTDADAAARVRYLTASLTSARFRLDMIEGARAPFVQESERLFALRPNLHPLSHYEPIIARIEAIVPGQGPLPARIAAFSTPYAIPADRLQRVMDAAIAECRRRTAAHLDLPQGETFTLEFVTGQSWSAYNWYQGQNRSLIQVNTDQPITVDRALGLGCHEGYPGHHVQGIFAERLYRERGWIEFSVAPLFHPAGPLNEGAGNYGLELAFPGAERLAYQRDVLYPLAGLDPTSAQAFDQLRRAMEELAGARLTVAQMYLDGEIDRARASELLQRYQLTTPERAEQSLRFIDHYRSYVINYVTGEEVVRAYIERAGPTPAARWAAYERMLTTPTLPGDLR